MLWQKLIILFMIAAGESLMIVAQIFGAKASAAGIRVGEILKPNGWHVWISVAGVCIVLAGYLYGIKVFDDIWLVTLTSWTALVVAEIALAWFVFHTIPHGTTLAGFLLVLAGFIVANL